MANRQPEEILKELLESLMGKGASVMSDKDLKENLRDQGPEAVGVLEALEKLGKAKGLDKDASIDSLFIAVTTNKGDDRNGMFFGGGSPRDMIFSLATAIHEQKMIREIVKTALRLVEEREQFQDHGDEEGVCPNCGKNHKEEIKKIIDKFFN